MPPSNGLTHLKQYDIKDSNVEYIGTEIDHRVKYASASTEPAWNDGIVGKAAGLYIWRIEDFSVIPWPKTKYGHFYNGDSYVILHSFKIGSRNGQEKLSHDIFFWLGSYTSQDEAGTAAYKTVELDEFLHGAATQHREIQAQPSEDFLSLFPQIRILSGGVSSGFTHVEEEKTHDITTLLRIFKYPSTGRAASIAVYEVNPIWQSLDDDDVFVLDKGKKLWVWQGKNCSPSEKGKAAQIVHDLTLAKHIDVEVISQTESRSKVIVDLLGGKDVHQTSFQASRPVLPSETKENSRPKKLFRLSDSSGDLSFDLVKSDEPIRKDDLDSRDVFLLDLGTSIWIWKGLDTSAAERAMWMKIAQSYTRMLNEKGLGVNSIPLASVAEGHESPAFLRAIEA